MAKHLPISSVRVGNLTFKVKWRKKRIGLTEDVGECDYDRQTISVWSGLPEESQRDTVMHEILHAIGHVFNVKFTEEEDVIRKFATGICIIFRDNPGLKEILFP